VISDQIFSNIFPDFPHIWTYKTRCKLYKGSPNYHLCTFLVQWNPCFLRRSFFIYFPIVSYIKHVLYWWPSCIINECKNINFVNDHPSFIYILFHLKSLSSFWMKDYWSSANQIANFIVIKIINCNGVQQRNITVYW